MDSVFVAWLDLVAALGLIVALGFVYARFRRVLCYPLLGQMAVGTSFGVVALLQMHHPIEPFDGLIIDLRNVPVALAGAFLGGPAALVTLIIGALGRASIGGIGMWAGMLGMVLAVCAGRLWAHWYRDPESRTVATVFVLAGMMSAHLLGALILPLDMAYWFYTNAAPTIIILNLVTVPLLAGMLEAERRSFETEQVLRASASIDHDTGLMTLPVLQRECAVRAIAMGDGSFTHAIVLRLRSTHPLSIWNTKHMQKRLVAAMRLRLVSTLPDCDIASVYGTSMLVLPITQAEMLAIEDTKIKLRRAATEDPYALTGSGGHRIAVDLYVIDMETEIDSLRRLAQGQTRKKRNKSRNTRRPFGKADATQLAQLRSVRRGDPKLETLFAKAEFLMNQNNTFVGRSG